MLIRTPLGLDQSLLNRGVVALEGLFISGNLRMGFSEGALIAGVLTKRSSTVLNLTQYMLISVYLFTGKWLACQSMDNKIVIFNVLNRMKYMRKKIFKGHMVAGYACNVDFSPDMRYVEISQ